MVAHRLANPVVIGGDVHATYAADVKRDFDAPDSATVASEVCGTSITSQGPTSASVATLGAANPHLRYANGAARGYVAMTLARARAEATLQAVETVKRSDSPVRALMRATVEAGRPGVSVDIA